MDRYDHLIVGGGLAAASAVEGIRELDEEGEILVLSDESEPPYHRPPLSKEFLQAPGAGRELLHVKPEGWFDEQAGVELRTGVRVLDLEPRERVVTTRDGEEIGGDRVLLATGGRARTLDVEGSDLQGVHTLRTVEDSEALRDAAGEVDRAVLVGAGFIGMELAASLRELDVAPTVVELQDRVWSRLLPPELSEFVRGYYEERGVDFRLESSVEAFRGDGRLEGAVLDDGSELPCGLAVVGVGIAPAQELASDAGLAVKDGVVVDEEGETSHGYIYATGDVARFPDPVFGDLTRVEHWDHAKAHGKLVGRNMAGAGEAYDHLSYFFTEAFDLSINVFGRPAEADRTLVRGELGPEGAVVYCGSDGRLCATILVNDHDAMDECRELVRRRPSMEEVEAMLEDAGSDTAEVGG
jgi:NADPH-dependent 2,4-dienoyl-CoA reductase/sulfur reductase-like enzyme